MEIPARTDRSTRTFPKAPWTAPTSDQATHIWRTNVEHSLTHLNDAIDRAWPNDLYVPVLHTGANRAIFDLIEKVLDCDGQANPDDRHSLIQWLGQAAAICSQGGGWSDESVMTSGQPNKPEIRENIRGPIFFVESQLMELWAASAWRSQPYTCAPEWADALVGQICRSTATDLQSPHGVWAEIPPN